MSINACTINSETIDSFCGIQRSKVLNRLLLSKYGPVVNPPAPAPAPTPGSGGGTVRPGTPGSWNNYQQSSDFEIHDQALKYEQSLVTVDVEFLNAKGTETQNFTTDNLDFVTVTNLDLGAEEFVSISDLDLGAEEFVSISDLDLGAEEFVTVTNLDLGAEEFVSITDFIIEQELLIDVNISNLHID